MPNYRYGCRSERDPVCPSNFGKDLWMQVCLGETSEQLSPAAFYSLRDILVAHNLFHKHITLKIDVEGSEYPGLRYFPLDFFKYIDQLIIVWTFSDYPTAYWGNL